MKFDLVSIKKNLMIKYPFFGGILANVKFVENNSVGTAATDGKRIYYSNNFLDTLDEKQQTFVLAHEVCHIAFNHILRSEGKNQRLWNIATDAVINALLSKDGLPIAVGGIDIPEAINHNAEEMYEKLLKEQEENQQGNGNGEGDQQESGDGDIQQQDDSNPGHDNHDLWDKVVKEKNSQGISDTSDEDFEQDEMKQNINQCSDQGEQETFQNNKELRKKKLDELLNSRADQSHGKQGTDDSGNRNVKDIGTSFPIIDWRRVLREAISMEQEWSYRNATIEHGFITPHLEQIPIPQTEIVLDTSGSIDEELLKNFLRECKNILKDSRVKIGCFDTRFYGFKEIRNIKEIDNMDFPGGGGTNFDVAVEAFSNRVENRIIFTDGEANMPKKSMDVIWVVFGRQKIQPKGGRVVYISQKQLEELNRKNNSRR